MKFATSTSSICADRLEGVQVVFAGEALDVLALAGEVRRRRVHVLALAVEEGDHGLLGQPVDDDVGALLTQLADDREVAPGMAEADR